MRILQSAPKNTPPNTPPKVRPEPQGPNKGDVHSKMMFIAWLAAANIGLWSMAFKHYSWAYHVHYYSMLILTIITWMSGFLALVEFGFPSRAGSLHSGIGIAIMVLVVLQTVGGMICWLLQKSATGKTKIIPIMGIIHQILGWASLILAMVQILIISQEHDKDNFLIYLIISLVSYVSFLLYKFLRKKLQSKNSIKINSQTVPLLTSSHDLSEYRGNQFIFADQVYDIDKVITNHPGGYEFINRIRGRQVDRYLYGSEPLESTDSQRVHSHSSDSIKLAGDPIGVLASVCPFSNMEDSNEVTLEKLVLPTRSSYIFAPYLLAKGDKQFRYTGYEHLSQIGKYYTVTIDGKKTRLYTMVNFLQRDNIDLMSRITGANYIQRSVILKDNSVVLDQINTQMRTLARDYYSIPLLMKKYETGQFTSDFLSRQFDGRIKLSKPLGKGMNLEQMPNGKIVMFAAGTGLYPYCDLIDLLFKDLIVRQKTPYTTQILSKNPIIARQQLLNRFSFCLYLSVPSTNDIHLITIQQLNELSKNKLMEVYIRSSENSDEFYKQWPYINKLDKRFEECIGSVSKQISQISQIYVCGPASISGSVVKCFQNYKIPSYRYKIL